MYVYIYIYVVTCVRCIYVYVHVCISSSTAHNRDVLISTCLRVYTYEYVCTHFFVMWTIRSVCDIRIICYKHMYTKNTHVHTRTHTQTEEAPLQEPCSEAQGGNPTSWTAGRAQSSIVASLDPMSTRTCGADVEETETTHRPVRGCKVG